MANTTTRKNTADAVLERQLDVPQFNSNGKPETNVQVVFVEKPSDRDERTDKFIVWSFAMILTLLNFFLLIKQVW